MRSWWIRRRGGMLVVALALLPVWAQAAIDPEQFRQGTPEGVVVEVMASRYEQGQGHGRVYLAARIIEVVWTATQLKAGDVILVAYYQDHEKYKKDRAALKKRLAQKGGWTGPQVLSYPPVLQVGSVHMAHLAEAADDGSSGRVYTAAAHQYSFQPASSKEQYRDRARQETVRELYRTKDLDPEDLDAAE